MCGQGEPAHQGQQGLGLAVAAGERLEQQRRQLRIADDLVPAQAEQIAGHQGGCFESLLAGERFAEGFIGTDQPEQQGVPLLADGAELDHAATHQPDVLPEQRNATAGSQMHEVAALVGVFESGAKTVLAAWSEHHRAVVRRLAQNCMERHRRRGKAAVVLWLRLD